MLKRRLTSLSQMVPARNVKLALLLILRTDLESELNVLKENAMTDRERTKKMESAMTARTT
jgi:hypothetical protein